MFVLVFVCVNGLDWMGVSVLAISLRACISDICARLSMALVCCVCSRVVAIVLWLETQEWAALVAYLVVNSVAVALQVHPQNKTPPQTYARTHAHTMRSIQLHDDL